MSGETFTERFKRLTAGIPEPELLYILGVKDGALQKLIDGSTQSLKLEAGLRLADRLGVSPWLFTSSPERATLPVVSALVAETDAIEALQRQIDRLAKDVATLKGAGSRRTRAS